MDIEVFVTKNKEELISALYDGMTELHSEMEERIFDKAKDSKGLDPKPYDTTAMWISNKYYPDGVRKAGTTTKSGKSQYFKGGYSQLKAEIGRPPLKLSNNLYNNFTTSLRQINDLEFHIVLEDTNAKKVEKHFSEFFKPSEEELTNLKKNLGGR